jgi:hypothetical protein
MLIMKRKIVITVASFFVTLVTMTQTNYYPNTTGTITKSGYTYKYGHDQIVGNPMPDRIRLYNAANPFLNTEWGNKDGSPLTFAEAMGYDTKKAFSTSSQTIAETLAMVDNLFTTQQKATLSGKSMFVSLRIDSSTGKVGDVYFSFFRDGPFTKIPVETYRSIELALKQNLSVTLTPDGRKLTYIQLFWSQKF